MAVAIPPKLWTVDEFERLDTLGFFEDARYELIEGEITAKMGQNGPHLVSTSLTSRALQRIFGDSFTVTQHSAYYLRPRNRPEPDVLVFPGDPRDYEPGWVGAENVLLAVEVADTRLDSAEAKIEIYARHGLREYWIIDIPRRELRVFRDAVSDEGRWRQAFALNEDESAKIHGSEICVMDLLPRKVQEPAETP